eukprot:15983-Heterococcus_DN1.PRE.1
MHAVCVALLRCVTVNSHQQLSQGPRIVQEQALTAIASAAEAAGTAFAAHYATTMPLLKQVLAGCASCGKEYRLLRAKALECVSLVGRAAGKDLFFTDALAVMDEMIALSIVVVPAQQQQQQSQQQHQQQQQGLADDDPLKQHMLKAWSHTAVECSVAVSALLLPSSTRASTLLCTATSSFNVSRLSANTFNRCAVLWLARHSKCLGADFRPYLPLVMPPLLAAVSAVIEVELPADVRGDVTASHAYVADAESDVECVSDGRGGVVAVRCSALEAQSAACQ